jgi:hypothetical protein
MTWSCVGIAVAVYRLSARATRGMDGGRLIHTKIPYSRRDITMDEILELSRTQHLEKEKHSLL